MAEKPNPSGAKAKISPDSETSTGSAGDDNSLDNLSPFHSSSISIGSSQSIQGSSTRSEPSSFSPQPSQSDIVQGILTTVINLEVDLNPRGPDHERPSLSAVVTPPTSAVQSCAAAAMSPEPQEDDGNSGCGLCSLYACICPPGEQEEPPAVETEERSEPPNNEENTELSDLSSNVNKQK